jgi:hypothetical protein
MSEILNPIPNEYIKIIAIFMTEFKILNISENKIGATNQRIAVFEMVEIKYSSFSFPGFKKSFTFDSSGDQYVIDLNSNLAKSLINKAQNEEIVSIDLSEFTKKTERDSGKIVIRYFHNNVLFKPAEGTIEYFVKCRGCGKEYREKIEEKNLKIHENLNIKDLSELSLVIAIENTRFRDQTNCKFCNEFNCEIHNIFIDGIKVYQPQKHSNSKLGEEYFFTISIKKSNNHLIFEVGGDLQIPMLFIWEALSAIIHRINKRGIRHFESKSEGYFNISVIGNFNNSKVIHFRSDGLTKKEIVDRINRWAEENNIMPDKNL